MEISSLFQKSVHKNYEIQNDPKTNIKCEMKLLGIVIVIIVN